MALPHYLTSGASSRAHYALLRKLDTAGTLHDADEAIREEVGRCRTVLEGNVSFLPLVVLRVSRVSACHFTLATLSCDYAA